MHRAKVITEKNYKLQPFTIDLSNKVQFMVNGIYDIFSQKLVNEYNTNMIVNDLKDAAQILVTAIKGYETKTSYMYFLFDTDADKLIGILNIISPIGIKSSYPAIEYITNLENEMDTTWAIEYYIEPKYWNKGICSYFVNALLIILKEQGVKNITAISNTKNKISNHLLEKLNFKPFVKHEDYLGQIVWSKNL